MIVTAILNIESAQQLNLTHGWPKINLSVSCTCHPQRSFYLSNHFITIDKIAKRIFHRFFSLWWMICECNLTASLMLKHHVLNELPFDWLFLVCSRHRSKYTYWTHHTIYTPPTEKHGINWSLRYHNNTQSTNHMYTSLCVLQIFLKMKYRWCIDYKPTRKKIHILLFHI